MAGLGLPFHSFSHPQLSSPLLLFSSLVKHILYLLALGPKSLLLLALAPTLSIFQIQTSPDVVSQLPHHLFCFPVFKVSLTFRQVECSAPGAKAEPGALKDFPAHILFFTEPNSHEPQHPDSERGAGADQEHLKLICTGPPSLHPRSGPSPPYFPVELSSITVEQCGKITRPDADARTNLTTRGHS